MQPLDEVGYVDISWQGDADRLTINASAVYDNEIFLEYAGDGQSQSGVPLAEITNIETAARQLIISGQLRYAGGEITIEYFRENVYVRGSAVDAVHQWKTYNEQESARFRGEIRHTGFDSDQDLEIELNPANGNHVSVNLLTLRHHYNILETVRVNSSTRSIDSLENGAYFKTILMESMEQIGGTRTNAQKLAAPAMYALLVVQ